jgi:hypothetical protein
LVYALVRKDQMVAMFMRPDQKGAGMSAQATTWTLFGSMLFMGPFLGLLAALVDGWIPSPSTTSLLSRSGWCCLGWQLPLDAEFGSPPEDAQPRANRLAGVVPRHGPHADEGWSHYAARAIPGERLNNGLACRAGLGEAELPACFGRVAKKALPAQPKLVPLQR